MKLNIRSFFKAVNPMKTLNLGKQEDRKYYIDFTSVRGDNIIKAMARTISRRSDEKTCQLFTGHVGCGKSTELSLLKNNLEEEGFHVVYFESSQDLDLADVEISDILLAIAHQVSQSLEDAKINLQPTRFDRLLQGGVNLLNSEVKGLELKIPKLGEVGAKLDNDKFSLAFGIGKINTEVKGNPTLRSLLRDYMGPRINTIVEVINQELIKPAKEQLQEQGKEGLVVIIDNLDRIDNKQKSEKRTQPEYLFVDRGEQLNKLNCHVVYTIPLILAFSNDQENLRNRFGSDLKILPMVRIKDKDGSNDEKGLDLLRQMVLARTFPEIEPYKRFDFILEVFDSPETLEHLCSISGGHVRNLLGLLYRCLEKDDPPISRYSLDRIVNERCYQLSKAITQDERELLRQVATEKTVSGEEEYQTLLRSLFVFEYRDDNGGGWFDINPVLADAKELQMD
ncbi:MAG: ATP-binding protein [Moorea sp. SIO2B7]|nr:ATP-binding protein [Moorena sp. SIO2B7]